MKFPKENVIDKWLQENPNPEIERLVERNLAISTKVLDILKERNISKSEFAKSMGKQPSEISKWLSGTHNLNMKSIVKMEVALDVDLISFETAPKAEDIETTIDTEYVYFTNSGQNKEENKFDNYSELKTEIIVSKELNQSIWKSIIENITRDDLEIFFNNALVKETKSKHPSTKKECKVIPMQAA